MHIYAYEDGRAGAAEACGYGGHAAEATTSTTITDAWPYTYMFAQQQSNQMETVFFVIISEMNIRFTEKTNCL